MINVTMVTTNFEEQKISLDDHMTSLDDHMILPDHVTGHIHDLPVR